MMRASVVPALATMLALLSGEGLQAAGPKDEPWIFVVHDGDTLLPEDADRVAAVKDPSAQRELEKKIKAGYRKRGAKKPEDLKYHELMGNYQPWEAPVDHPSDFYDWIAAHSRAYEDVEGCFGAHLKPEAMTLSERTFDLAFDWMLGRGFTNDVLYPRPHGKQVQRIMGFTRELPGKANYLTCKPSGFFSVAKTGKLSANRIEVGPGANDLVKRMPTFHLSAAHELAHLVQNNTAPGAKSASIAHRKASNARWITEGAADAIGVLHARDHHGGKSYFGPYSDKYYRRFFLSRAYNVPLNKPHSEQSRADYGSSGTTQQQLLASIEKSALDNLDYQTNGFWFHVIERYLDGDPRGLHPLYRSMTGDAVAQNATALVDRWLDSIDGGLDGLEHVLPQFLAEYASWAAHRFEKRMSKEKWLNLGFSGCRELRIATGADSVSTTLQLAEYSGNCIHLKVNPYTALLRPDIQLRITGPNDVVDDIYLGWAEGNDFKDAPDAQDCFEHVEQNGRRGGGAPCLLVPNDGMSGGQYQRFFYFPEIVQAGPRKDTEFLLVATWVPGKIQDARRDFRVEDIRVTASVDVAELSSGGASKEPATTDYASKKGRAPVSAEGEKTPGQATMRDIFIGNFATMPGLTPSMTRTMRRQIEGSVAVVLDSEDGARDRTRVTLFFEEPLTIGHEGPIKAFAASENGERMGIQNPAEESRIVIEEYNGETLRFRGVAQVCEGGMAAMMSAGQGADLCQVLPPKRYEVSGVIAYPTARNTEARLAQPPGSEAYRNYQDIRLSRLEQRMGIPGRMTGTDDSDDGPGPDDGGTQTGYGGKDTQGPDCDCGCQSPDRKSGDLQCKLLCGKAWKQCDAP
ncbi:hypothetical protein M8756_16115 [Lutimaribacter sp. EGI FJ00015]|uniref:Uncharacterized protein n=1 Tax=Lutimaribacter degradans TaxID=2945989 RepID=A0ACC5ZZL8_9RHOB|nr:hypothetical protein [Lutimaribacter sp. EGI FJ00013]MCM2563620.1 hypothetical protein [Lutimaribacter sp. EGI FJ00013]MCO0614844.1 hypothetical protein [Lutimaribacter sp. EGI FJ00015]MCO0637472.1 hypothetical protein [Lutimaribacter sp. EGI FJ00014]